MQKNTSFSKLFEFHSSLQAGNINRGSGFCRLSGMSRLLTLDSRALPGPSLFAWTSRLQPCTNFGLGLEVFRFWLSQVFRFQFDRLKYWEWAQVDTSTGFCCLDQLENVDPELRHHHPFLDCTHRYHQQLVSWSLISLSSRSYQLNSWTSGFHTAGRRSSATIPMSLSLHQPGKRWMIFLQSNVSLYERSFNIDCQLEIQTRCARILLRSSAPSLSSHRFGKHSD